MSEPEQCIICLDSLPLPGALPALDPTEPDAPAAAAAAAAAALEEPPTTAATTTTTTTTTNHQRQDNEEIRENGDADLSGGKAGLEKGRLAAPAPAPARPASPNPLHIVAALDGCNHIIHDACIRSWAQKTNTCPICRNTFHTVRVINGLDGELPGFLPMFPEPSC